MIGTRYAFAIAILATLAGCNSTDSGFGIDGTGGKQGTGVSQSGSGPGSPLPTPSAIGSTAELPATSPSATGSQTASLQSGDVRMRFAPIIGAPVEKVTSLSRRFSLRAREQKVAIVGSTDQTATHVLKGYFSVLPEGSNSTVIYVFDILDPAGSRLHRIQGQEVVAGSNGSEPWSAIPAATLEKIADKAMAEFSAWRATQA